MIIVRLTGGLGNQMFQYALGRHLANKHRTVLKLDLSDYEDERPKPANHVPRTYDLDIFNICENFASKEEVEFFTRRYSNNLIDKALNKLIGLKKSFIREPHFHFSEKVFEAPDDVYLDGYWQTDKYFADIEPLIRSDFTFKESICDRAAELLAEISGVNSICVNVRRGDFVANNRHGWFGAEYIKRGEEIMSRSFSDHRFFVFSDEIDWCRENLRFETQATFVSHDFAGRKFQDYLRLMASCRHFIIPNSSFAWWAVWFNQNPERIVIAPRIWFNVESLDTRDLIPTDWIRI
jgi:hypothetical protein